MMRVLAVIVATVGFLSMAPAGHAAGSAMDGGLVAHRSASPSMVGDLPARCQGGNPCPLVCAAYFPVPCEQANAVLADSKTRSGLDRLVSFDLSWLLYRPPKAG